MSGLVLFDFSPSAAIVGLGDRAFTNLSDKRLDQRKTFPPSAQTGLFDAGSSTEDICPLTKEVFSLAACQGGEKG